MGIELRKAGIRVITTGLGIGLGAVVIWVLYVVSMIIDSRATDRWILRAQEKLRENMY